MFKPDANRRGRVVPARRRRGIGNIGHRCQSDNSFSRWLFVFKYFQDIFRSDALSLVFIEETPFRFKCLLASKNFTSKLKMSVLRPFRCAIQVCLNE